MKNQIFTTGTRQKEDNKELEKESFQYVLILMNVIESNADKSEPDKILIQIIDYSDRFLYNSIKEE